MKQNVAGQKWLVFAYDAITGDPVTGDAGNISAQISKGFGSPAALTDAHPVEVDSVNRPGYYLFDITQAETNEHELWLYPVSSTVDVKVSARPDVAYTTIEADIAALALDIPTVAEFNNRTLASGDYAEAGDLAQAAEIVADIFAKLPADSRLIAGAGDVATNLDDVEPPAPVSSQPRYNFAPDPAYTLTVPSAGPDYICGRPIKVVPGPLQNVAVALDMSGLFGKANFVTNVGDPVFSEDDTLEMVEVGPRDWYAMVVLGGEIEAGAEIMVTVNVTMLTGTSRPVKFRVLAYEDS